MAPGRWPFGRTAYRHPASTCGCAKSPQFLEGLGGAPGHDGGAKKKPRRLITLRGSFRRLKVVSSFRGDASTRSGRPSIRRNHSTGRVNQFMSRQSRPFKIPRAMGKSNQDGDGGGEIRHERQCESRGSWRPCPLLMDRWRGTPPAGFPGIKRHPRQRRPRRPGTAKKKPRRGLGPTRLFSAIGSRHRCHPLARWNRMVMRSSQPGWGLESSIVLLTLMDRRRRHSLSSTHAAAPLPSTMAIRADPWRLSCHRCQWPGAGPCVRATAGRRRLLGPAADR